MEKSTYNADEEDWSIPYLKRRSLDAIVGSSQVQYHGNFLPDIGGKSAAGHLNGVSNNQGEAKFSHNNHNNNNTDMMMGETVNFSTMANSTTVLPSFANNSGLKSRGGKKTLSNQASINQLKSVEEIAGSNTNTGKAGNPTSGSLSSRIPPISLPGNGYPSSSGNTNNSNTSSYPSNGSNGYYGSQSSARRESDNNNNLPSNSNTSVAKKKKKKKTKNTSKMPEIPKVYDSNGELLPDEAGGGEYAGPLADWGFADETPERYQTVDQGPDDQDNEYEDDEFEPDEIGAGASIPPIAAVPPLSSSQDPDLWPRKVPSRSKPSNKSSLSEMEYHENMENHSFYSSASTIRSARQALNDTHGNNGGTSNNSSSSSYVSSSLNSGSTIRKISPRAVVASTGLMLPQI